jgi:hypothetical protein
MTDYVAKCILLFLLSSAACGAAFGWVPSDTSQQGPWGDWGEGASCPAGAFVWGFRLKSESYQGSGDDTALNAIELICKNRDSGDITRIRSAEGQWGTWGKDHMCTNWPPQGFWIQVEKYQGLNKDRTSKDDTAANNIRFTCDGGDGSDLAGDPPTAWGDWTRLSICPPGMKINGFRTKVERPQGDGDDTALNGMQVLCGQP